MIALDKSYHSACHSLAFAFYKSTSRTTTHAPQGSPMLHKKVACKIATVELPGCAPNLWRQDKEQLTPSSERITRSSMFIRFRKLGNVP
jgi:hypothetical protein